MSHGALPGFRDFYPSDMAERAHITRVWRDVATRYAFAEYDGPPLEPLELYTRKSGDEIVGQLYTFTDKGGREVALRPEMTPTLARMVAARAPALRKPVRWFSVPQLFRYERQQKGRLREHFQLNVDIIGEPDVTADAELLAVALDVMKALGLSSTDVRARVSDRKLLGALLTRLGIGESQLPKVFAVIDKQGREPRAVQSEKLAAAGVGPEAATALFQLLDARDLADVRARYGDTPEIAEHCDRLDRYLGYLGALGVLEWVQFDLSIVRGLAYYTGIVFELFDARGEFRAICGGGRYDTLLGALGGVEMPALGFGMGDVVIGEILRARGLLPSLAPAIDYWVAGEDQTMGHSVLEVASALRRRGNSVEYSLRAQVLSRQLKSAAAAGARKVVILKPELFARRSAIVRSLHDGSEEQVGLDDLLLSA